MLESDLKNIRIFVYSLLVLLLLSFILWFYTLLGLHYQSKCWRYQPEISWYSGPIGYDCGCK
jgi:hypothetical protein